MKFILNYFQNICIYIKYKYFIIFLNNDHLFTLNTNNINKSKLINQLSATDFDYELWHARLEHFNNNKNIINYVLEHTNLHNKRKLSTMSY